METGMEMEMGEGKGKRTDDANIHIERYPDQAPSDSFQT